MLVSPLVQLLIFFLSFIFRGRLKSPWSRRKRKHALSRQQWASLFTPDGKLRDGGVKFLKKVRSGVSYHPSHFSDISSQQHKFILSSVTNIGFLISDAGCRSKY